MIEENSRLWQYLRPPMRDLVKNGEFLIEDSARHTAGIPTDYSYLVFPFAKLYEGFLKQLFLDIHVIPTRDFQSDHFRIGKILSPNLVRLLRGRSAYGQIAARFDPRLAARLWDTWRTGRNLVFHYFPHNYRALTRDDAIAVVTTIVETMAEAVDTLNVHVSSLS